MIRLVIILLLFISSNKKVLMNYGENMKLKLAVLLVVLITNNAFADKNSHATYFEAAIGQSEFSGFCDTFNSSSCEKQDQVFRITGGIRFADSFALDASYFHFGKATNIGIGYQVTQKASSYSLQWSWRASKNIVSMYIKGGAAYINIDTESLRTCICANAVNLAGGSYSKVIPIATLGLEIPFSKEASAITQFEYLPDSSKNTVRNLNINSVNIGIRKLF